MAKNLKSHTDGHEVMYRMDDVCHSFGGIDEFNNLISRTYPIVENSFTEFKILRRTKCGIWIDNHGTERFVLLDARKKFACLTRKDAVISFIARKRKQIKILKAQLYRAGTALEILGVGESELTRKKKRGELLSEQFRARKSQL